MGEAAELEFDYEELKRLIKEQAFLRDDEGGFTLASGRVSNYLFDLKPLLLDPKGSNLISKGIYERIKDLNAGYVGGLESGAIPIVTALCMYSWKREKQFYGFFIRKEGKAHGVKKRIVGNFVENENVIIVEDVTTTGGSVINAVKAVRDKGCSVVKVISIVDRLEGAMENFHKEGIEFESLFTRKDFGIQ
ncbi:MAG: orotate phosphoribosyltransferase [Archaeoglobaceae archaeon]